MSAHDRQRDLELTATQMGVDRYMADYDGDTNAGRNWDRPQEGVYVSRMMALMIPAVINLQKEARAKLVSAQTTGRRLGGWEMPLAMSDAATVSYITIRTALTMKGSTRMAKHTTARHVGKICGLELQWEELRDKEKNLAKDEGRYNRIEGLKRTVKQINPKSLAKWLRRLDDIKTEQWDDAHNWAPPLMRQDLDAGYDCCLYMYPSILEMGMERLING